MCKSHCQLAGLVKTNSGPDLAPVPTPGPSDYGRTEGIVSNGGDRAACPSSGGNPRPWVNHPGWEN